MLALLSGCTDHSAHIPAPRDGSLASSSPSAAPTKTPATTVGRPTTLSIPAIHVKAHLVGVGLKDDGSMETPTYGSNQAGWYTEGPRPGEIGPAVIVGHVDNQHGPDVFASLTDLEPGDRVRVTDKTGHKYVWTVDHSEEAGKDQLPYQRIWANAKRPLLRLITCSGAYEGGKYQENLIVYADPAQRWWSNRSEPPGRLPH